MTRTSLLTSAVSDVGSSDALNSSGTTTAVFHIGKHHFQQQNTLTNFTSATGVWNQALSVTITPGIWIIAANVLYDKNGGTVTEFATAITTTSGTTNPGDLNNSMTNYSVADVNNANYGMMSIPGHRIAVTSNTTYYLKVRAAYSAGTPQWRGHIIATRVL